MPCNARAGRGDRLDVFDTFGGFQDGMDHDRPANAMTRFQLRQQLIQIMNIPGAFHFRQHHHIELIADRGHDVGNVVEHPGAVEAVDSRPTVLFRRNHCRAPSG